jgi:hypothetical protein
MAKQTRGRNTTLAGKLNLQFHGPYYAYIEADTRGVWPDETSLYCNKLNWFCAQEIRTMAPSLYKTMGTCNINKLNPHCAFVTNHAILFIE